MLEVALLEEDDSAWTLLPYTAGGGSSPGQKRPAVGDVVEEEVFEYERYLPLRGWSPDHLKGLDPHRYSRHKDGSRGSSSFPRVPLSQVRSLGPGLPNSRRCCVVVTGKQQSLHKKHAICQHVCYPTYLSVDLGLDLQCKLTACFRADQGWEWEGPWEVEIHGNVDPDGWAYAFEPRQFKWPPEPGAGIKKAHDFVRR